MKRKSLSLLLMICMLLCMVPTAAYALTPATYTYTYTDIDLGSAPSGDGYSLADGVLTLNNVYVSGSISGIPEDAAIQLEGANYVGSGLELRSSTNGAVTIAGVGSEKAVLEAGLRPVSGKTLNLTLTNISYCGAIYNANVGFADLLTIDKCDGTFEIEWMSNAGVAFTESSITLGGGRAWIEKIVMDDASSIHLEGELHNYGNVDDRDWMDALEVYLPIGQGLSVGTCQKGDCEPYNTILTSDGEHASDVKLEGQTAPAPEPDPEPTPVPDYFYESAKVFKITVEDVSGGKVSQSRFFVGEGGNVDFKITADEGMVMTDLLINGESVGAAAEYTYVNVTCDLVVTAVFEAAPPAAPEGPAEDPAEPEVPAAPEADADAAEPADEPEAPVSDVPKTGDNGGMLYLMLMMLSAAGLAVLRKYAAEK